MAILVTGGAGFIGSHTCVEMLNAGYEVIVVDNLCNASEEAIRRVEKITGKNVTFANMSDKIDIDASPYIYGTKTMTELGDELMTEIKEVADGKLTKAEALGYTEMAIARVCNYM